MKPGTLIHGTMRPQDLIPAFLTALRRYDRDAYAQLMLSPFGPIPAYVNDEGDDCEWWDSDEAAALLSDLFDSLDAAAGEFGLMFGSHPGDGSDFGFWPESDEFGTDGAA